MSLKAKAGLVVVLGIFFGFSAFFFPVRAIMCGSKLSIPGITEKVPPGCLCSLVCKAPTSVSCSIDGIEYCCPNFDQCTCSQKGNLYTALGCLPVGAKNGGLNEFAGWFTSKAIYIASGIAFLLMVYGGFLLLTSSGDPNKVKAGTELITAALSGLLFIIVSVLLLKIIGVDILQIPGFFK